MVQPLIGPAEAADGRWWQVGLDNQTNKPHEVIDKVIGAVKPWFDQRKLRHDEYLRVYGISGQEYGQTTNRPHADDLKFAHAANVIDTVCTKVCKSRVVPMALTSGGTWGERQRAKGFNRFISGLFWETAVFDNDYRWTTDCLIKDVGVAKVVERGGRVCVDRVDPDSLYWDPGEAYLAGSVRTIYEESYIDRFRLCELLCEWGEDTPENLKHVYEVRYEPRDDPRYASPHNADMVRVREAWHLPSGKGCKDGKHAFTVKDRTLFVEDYDSERLPHVLLTNKFPLYGLTAPPMMAKLVDPQREFDKLTDKLREAHALMGSPRVFLRRGANINKAEVDDVPGSFVHVDDPQTDIKEWTPTPIHPDTYNYRSTIMADMEKAAGIPETNLQGTPPEGISAAKALQLLDDLVAEKLTQFIRCRETFFVGIAERVLEVVRNCSVGGSYKVLAETGENRLLAEVDLKDVDIPLGSYKLKVFPTSFLSQSPSARYEFLSEMRQRGDIDELEFRQLVDMPDLDAENDMETATVDIIDKCIDAIVTKGMAFTAEPFDDHTLIVQRGSKAYNLARIRGPEPGEADYNEHQNRLRALKEYVLSALYYLKPPPPPPESAAQAAAGAPGPMGGNPAGPMPPPDAGIPGMVPPAPVVPPTAIAPGTPPPVNPFTPGEQLSNF